MRGRNTCLTSRITSPWVIMIETPPGSFSLFFSLCLCRREIEGRGGRRRPQVTFWIINSMPGVNERERKGGSRGEWRWGSAGGKVEVWKKKQCFHFLSSLLGGFRQWIFTKASPCCALSCHCKVCENSAHNKLKAEGTKARKSKLTRYKAHKFLLSNQKSK